MRIHPVYLSQSVVNSFEDGDQRMVAWVKGVPVGLNTFYHAYKYKIGSEEMPALEYPMILRLAELYLIRAEARIQLNNISGSLEDLNSIQEQSRFT